MSSLKQQQVWQYIERNKLVSSVDITRLGLNIGYLCAPREVRRWAESGKIKRLSKEEKILRGLVKKGNADIAWYEL